MKNKPIVIQRYDADDGKVFDYMPPRFKEDEEGNQIQQHFYAKTIYIGKNDSIDNYIEVDEPIVEEVEEDGYTTD